MGKPKAKGIKSKSKSISSNSKKNTLIKKGFLKNSKNSKNIKKKHKWTKSKGKIIGDVQATSLAVNSNSLNSQNAQKGKLSLGLSLRDKMVKQLNAARFRQINETLDSGVVAPRDAFGDDYNLYEKYHETYNELKNGWEVKPLDSIIQIIQSIQSQLQLQLNGQNLNQNESIQVVDFGCGDGDLENTFNTLNEGSGTNEESGSGRSVKVYGLDLYKLHPNTIVCDMTKVPFQNNSIDIAVFCLSLMAKDVGKFIIEANRILKMKGTLIIGEVESRFQGGAKKFTMNLIKYGFVTLKMKNQDQDQDNSNKNNNRKHDAHLNHLRLNDMFIIMKFKKVKNVIGRDSFLPDLLMKPCVYKKR